MSESFIDDFADFEKIFITVTLYIKLYIAQMKMFVFFKKKIPSKH